MKLHDLCFLLGAAVGVNTFATLFFLVIGRNDFAIMHLVLTTFSALLYWRATKPEKG